MTQGAGQGPVVRTDTVRDFRVPAYVHQAGQEASGAEEPEGYTPTQRDLPVINRGDTVQVTVQVEEDPCRATRASARSTSWAMCTAIWTS